MTPLSHDVAPTSANGKSLDRAVEPSTGQPRERRLALYQWLIRHLFPGVKVPIRIVFYNGTEVATAPGTPIATVHIRDRATFLQMAVNLDIAFGDAYSEGRIEVEGDLLAFLVEAFRAPPAPATVQVLRHWIARWNARPRPNSIDKSRDNVWHHYDLGNDFYKLWLDEQLVYTCAYFPTPTATLEEAQIAKMERVCRKLWLKPGETVVEAGCGWGALARHMAKFHGVKVRAFNLSREQVAYARQRAREEGLADRIEYVEADYRSITGQYDVFVSVGMLEHVGPQNYRTLGRVIQNVLKPTGRGLIHSIGRNQPSQTNPWLEKRIFPGAYMPSPREFSTIFEPFDFSVIDVENLRLHYAKTLEHWWQRFDAVADKVRGMFDERFVRMWRMYLASSQAGFLSGTIQLFQFVFVPGKSNEVPWTRDLLYDKPAYPAPHHKSLGNGVINAHGSQ